MITKSDRPILILQNCRIESAGSILPYLRNEGQSFKIVRMYAGEPIPELENYRGIINLGCPESAYEFDRIDFLGQVYKAVERSLKSGLPYYGICCGAQILALVLGARVSPNRIKEIGCYRVSLTKAGTKDECFKGFDSEFPVFQWHGDTFEIPTGGALLVTGTDCYNQAFRYDRAIGIQFHLEADPNELPLWCDSYQSELTELRKTKDILVRNYRTVAPEIAALNDILLRNLINETNNYLAE